AIEGGKFANGALWGAFIQLQMDSNAYQWSKGIQSSSLVGLVNATQTVVQDATYLIATINSLPTTLKGVSAAATFSTISTFDASIGPYDLQTNMMLAAAVQQMQHDPFRVGSLILSTNIALGLNTSWQQTSQNLSASYFASYAYGFSAW